MTVAAVAHLVAELMGAGFGRRFVEGCEGGGGEEEEEGCEIHFWFENMGLSWRDKRTSDFASW